MSISIHDLDHKLLSLDDVTRQLQLTEPLETINVDADNDISFHMEPDWASGIDALEKTDLVPVTMTIDGTERQMTKEAVNQAAAAHGLLAPYVKKVPAVHIERLLNWHYGAGMGGTELNAFVAGGHLTAFGKATRLPFSNLQLLERTVEGIRKTQGSDAPIYADYKFSNSFLKTNIRLITPATDRVIHDGMMADVPEGQDDLWYAGVHLSNSLVGKTQTTMEAYLFRYWCTNGYTSTISESGVWNRRSDGQNDTVYDWAAETVEEILGGLEHHFDQVQSLTTLSTEGNTSDILRDIFTQYKVPVSQRNDIQSLLMDNPAETTLYHITNAISEAANDHDMVDSRRDRLMRIGGAIPTQTFDTLKAQIWEEGRGADRNAMNPYAIRAIA
jgi:hypothetical protein